MTDEAIAKAVSRMMPRGPDEYHVALATLARREGLVAARKMARKLKRRKTGRDKLDQWVDSEIRSMMGEVRKSQDVARARFKSLLKAVYDCAGELSMRFAGSDSGITQKSIRAITSRMYSDQSTLKAAPRLIREKHFSQALAKIAIARYGLAECASALEGRGEK